MTDLPPVEEATDSPEVTEPTASNRVWWRTPKWLAVASALVLVAGGGIYFLSSGDADLASETCERLNDEGLSIAEAESIARSAFLEGVLAGDVDFAEKLEARCEVGTVALGAAGLGSLKANLALELGTCSTRSIDGTARNTNIISVDVQISYELTTNDVRVGDGTVFVNDIAPAKTVQWDQPLFEDSYEHCEINVESVLPAR